MKLHDLLNLEIPSKHCFSTEEIEGTNQSEYIRLYHLEDKQTYAITSANLNNDKFEQVEGLIHIKSIFSAKNLKEKNASLARIAQLRDALTLIEREITSLPIPEPHK